MTLEETALFSKLTVRTFTVDPPETASCPDSKPLDFDISACYRVSFRVKYSQNHYFIAKTAWSEWHVSSELRCSGPDWYEFGEFCYKPFEEKKTWHSARTSCRQLGADLVSILSMTEQTVQQGKTDAWIGLRRLAGSDSYKWSDGWPVFFTHWGPGEPTNHEGEGCVSMHAPSHFIQGTWNDTACAAAKPYICKITKGKADKRTTMSG
uniref:C-type lectin domain-containing protein n=1 Tax=Cyprinus carpio TaxID=7962 RepID=A0A8C1PUM4_CYPCA